ncbi:MAG: calcium-binding protein, partial [Patulibacter sp.]
MKGPGRALPAGLALAALLGVAPSASAATASLRDGVLRVEASPSEALDVSVEPGDLGTVDVELGVAVAAPAGCSADLDVLVCPAAGLSRIEFAFGDGDDQLGVRGAVAVVADGGAGDDVLRGGDGADQLDGGNGDDRLDGGAGDDVLDGGDGDDVMRGGDGDDRLAEGAGDGVLDGGAGDDTLDGDDGNDSMAGGAGDDALDGGSGDGVLDGGDGDDRMTAGDGDDLLFGGVGDDAANGGAGADVLDLGSGDDTGRGGDGDDALLGGSGADQLAGDGGDDRLDGGDGGDTLAAGDGDDQLVAGVDGDRLQGDAGRDAVDASAQRSPVTIDLAAGVVRGTGPALDSLVDALEVAIGGAAGDVLVAGPGGAQLDGGPGDDLLVPGEGRDLLIGGDGRDTADYGARTEAVTLVADGVTPSGAAGEGDVIDGSVEVLAGGSGDDHLIGGAGLSELIGGPGDDVLEDLLDGARDVLRCGDGDDLAVADRSDDVQADCERWSDGAGLVRSAEPIRAAVRSRTLRIDRAGRMRLSLSCGREAAPDCRAKVVVELRHGGRWRRGPERSFLLTPGRRRNVVVFAQRGFKRLVALHGAHAKARVTLTVRDAIGRTATDRRELVLRLPVARRAQ